MHNVKLTGGPSPRRIILPDAGPVALRVGECRRGLTAADVAALEGEGWPIVVGDDPAPPAPPRARRSRRVAEDVAEPSEG